MYPGTSRTLLLAVTGLSLALLASIAAVHWMRPASIPGGGASSRLLAGEELRPQRPGAVSYADGAIGVHSLPQGLRILTSPLRLDGTRHPVLRIRVSGLDASSRLTFIWMLDDEQGSRFAHPLAHPVRGEVVADLSGLAGWQGRKIRTVGVQLSGTSGDNPVQIHSLRFESASTSAALWLLGSELLRFRPWSLSSINSLDSAAAPLGIPVDYAGTVFGMLALLGTAFIASMRQRWRAQRGTALWLAGLVVWGALALSWAHSLAQQGTLSHQSYRLAEGRPQTINGADQRLWQIARNVKAQVPEAGARVFLLHDSSGHNFYRLRLQHHLLPLNVYNFGSTPPPGQLRPDDYVLLLDAPNPASMSSVMEQWSPSAPPLRRLYADQDFTLLQVLTRPREEIDHAP